MLMKKLVWSSFVLAATSQAMGCILVSDDDDTGSVSVSWSPLTVDSNGNEVAATCPEGATTAIIYALPDGSSDPYEDWVDCGDGAGTARDLPEGPYQVWVRLTDSTRVNRFAESGSALVDVVAGETSTVPRLDIFVDHAFYTVAWRLLGGGVEAGCANVVGAGDVAIDATDGGGGLYDHLVPCEDGQGGFEAATKPLPINDNYTVSVQLMNAENSAAISEAAVVSDTETLSYGNQFSSLGTVDVVLE